MPLNEAGHPERLEQKQHEGRIAYCRCWQSKRFPLCDGSHRAYNAEHGDALGPLIIDSTDDT